MGFWQAEAAFDPFNTSFKLCVMLTDCREYLTQEPTELLLGFVTFLIDGIDLPAQSLIHTVYSRIQPLLYTIYPGIQSLLHSVYFVMERRGLFLQVASQLGKLFVSKQREKIA